ncbi:MAG: VWA domain-containing protein [Myxococcales bacterium]|nr:VWA domain-containing protein [Myxococcales bacterium]
MTSYKSNRLAQRALWCLGWLLVCCWLPGCALFNRLEVQSVATGQAPPSQVAAYVTIDQGGEAVAGLSEKNFRVFEDDADVTGSASLTLIDASKVAYHHTVVLVDVGSSAENVQMNGPLSELIARLRQTRDVTLFGFDGAEDLVPLGQFRAGTVSEVKLDRMNRLEPRDPSRNLNGAIVKGLEQLESKLMQVRRPVRRGSLLVITRGPDLARRVTEDRLAETLDKSQHDTFAVVLGKQENLRADDLGRSDSVDTETTSELPTALSRIARLMEARVKAEYVISYCSPARAGKRFVRIEATTLRDETEYKGNVEFEIDATGFGAGCNAARTPSFLSVTAAASTEPSAGPAPAPSDATETRPPTSPPPDSPDPATPEDGIVPPPDSPTYEPSE